MLRSGSKTDGAHLILLIHQGDGLANERDRLGDELIQKVVDVHDLFRLALRLILVSINSCTASSTIRSEEMS